MQRTRIMIFSDAVEHLVQCACVCAELISVTGPTYNSRPVANGQNYRGDTLKTDDGAVILVTYNGIGQTTDARASLRIAPLFETSDSRYVWLTRLQAVDVGERVGTTVTYDIYALK